MRVRGRTDRNQSELVSILRELGCTVTSLADTGGGTPDLLVGHRGLTYLIEVKAHRKAKLTDDQQRWHAAWRGAPVLVVHSPEQILDLFGQEANDAD
jgi:Holliday junction resolvase